MKFGKRFLSYQGSNDPSSFLDYKGLKQAIKADCEALDHIGSVFESALNAELVKVDKIYNGLEDALRLEVAQIESQGTVRDKLTRLANARQTIQEVTNFAALNYSAVLKAVKKRNRRLQLACGDSAITAASYDFLADKSFFKSTTLAQVLQSSLSISQRLEGDRPYAKLMHEFKCPICLESLSSPARLPCHHAFCWSCITMYCLRALQAEQPPASVMEAAQPQPGGQPAQPSNHVGPSKMSQVSNGWAPQPDSQTMDAKSFHCPVCQSRHALDLEALNVDKHICAMTDTPSSISDVSTQSAVTDSPVGGALSITEHSLERESSATAESLESLDGSGALASAEDAAQVTLVPPQAPRWLGKLSIVLDLDGTLIASFPPRRSPTLPAHVRTHLVGKGSSLNPQGVFVVERPGLVEFLRQTSQLGELIVFTAGLPEYAMPILCAIDPDGTFFGDRIVCRSGTSVANEYPCVKDLTRLARPLARTLIIDDTPLAFLWQPRNGVPVLGFRGSPDDNLLLDAVLPLLRSADAEADVRPYLDKRFGMEAWFHGHRYKTRPPKSHRRRGSKGGAAAGPPARSVAVEPAAADAAAVAHVAQRVSQQMANPGAVPRGGLLLLCDFDNTVVDFDVMERATEALAPELLPMLVALDSPADFVPVINVVLEEMRERGVSLDDIRRALRDVGREEVPQSMRTALQAVREAGDVTLRVLSNANDFFVSHVLEGAGMEDVFHCVVSNIGEVSCAAATEARDVIEGAVAHPHALSRDKLTILPCQPADKAHACAFCPAALCKGLYVRALLQYHPRVVFCGDGANDLCAVLCLREGDTALVRCGYKCCQLLEERAALGTAAVQPVCTVEYWNTQDDLAKVIPCKLC
eukprot:jgi/Ulvmu1/7301/UM035_0090.1